jgi:NAD(P)H-hydrate epimerase
LNILSAQQLAEADQSTIQKLQVSTLDLMERIATLIFERLHQRLNGAPVPIKVFCGIGKNGGDGLALARLLIQNGYQVTTYVANFSKDREQEFLTNYDRIKEVTKKWPLLITGIDDFPELSPQDIIVDALFGTGINRPIDGWMAQLVEHINKVPAFKVALDMPSGLFANTAQPANAPVVGVQHTFTFQAPKLSFYLPQTGMLVGSYEVVNIGLDPEYMAQAKPLAQLVTKNAVQRLYRNRPVFSHKGNYGHVVVMAGSQGYYGATILASGGAINSGAGKVTAYVPKNASSIVHTSLPEAMTIEDPNEHHIAHFNVSIDNHTLCVGPGIGVHDEVVSAFAKALSQQSTPTILDADALTILARNEGLWSSVPKGSVITPHEGELERLVGSWKDDYEKIEKAKELSTNRGVIVVIKGAHTLIIEGSQVYVNDTGNPGMATAGSGDVLSGVIASFIAQGYPPIQAAIFAVYVHGLAGDIAVQTYAHEGVKASIISNFIGPAILQLFKQDTPQIPAQQQ